MPPCHGGRPGGIPGSRTNLRKAEGRRPEAGTICAVRQLAQPGLQNPAGLGQHQGGAPLSTTASKPNRVSGFAAGPCLICLLPPSLFGVVADKQCPCPASRPMRERYPPTPPFQGRGLRIEDGEGAIGAAIRHLPSSILVSSTAGNSTKVQSEASYTSPGGCDSHPRHPFREVIRLPACKYGVVKPAGSDGWSVTSTSHQPSPAEQLRAKAVPPERVARRRTCSSAPAALGRAGHSRIRSSTRRVSRCLRER